MNNINRNSLNPFKNLTNSVKQAKDLCLGDFFNCWDAPNDDALMDVNLDWVEDVRKSENGGYPEWQEVKKVTIEETTDEKFIQPLLAKIELLSGRTIIAYALDEFGIKVHKVS